jgi:hypothetical protein
MPKELADTSITIADVLSGRTQATPLMKVTAGHRLYYNYRCHDQSFNAEVAHATVRRPPRDFRSLQERRRDRQ